MSYGSKMVYVEYEGDYCGPCSFCAYTDTGKAMCQIYRTRDDHPRLLKTKKIDLDYRPQYYPILRAQEKLNEAVRCRECLTEFRSYGPNRATPRGMILYPTPEQMVEGAWLDAGKIVDLAASLKGWLVQVQFGYAFEAEDEDSGEAIGICALFVKARKAPRGHVKDLGGTEGWRALDKLPKGAAESVMRWVGELYNELVDVPESVTDRLWSDLHGE